MCTWFRRRVPAHRIAITMFTAHGLALPVPLPASLLGTVAHTTAPVLACAALLGGGWPIDAF